MWYLPAMSALMAHTRAAISSTKRSGKRWRLGMSNLEVRNRWCAMLFVCRLKENRELSFEIYGSFINGSSLINYRETLTMSWKKNQACCSAASLTALVLTTHCKASSSWRSYGRERKPRQFRHILGHDKQRINHACNIHKICNLAVGLNLNQPAKKKKQNLNVFFGKI